MLSKEELKKLSICKYEEIVNKIMDCLNYYEKYHSKDNMYTIYLASGERIPFRFRDANIPHLLGVNTTYLSDVLKVKGDNAYEVLNNFISSSFEIYSKSCRGQADLSILFSKYIEDKLQTFKTIIEPLSPQRIYFISKFDSTRKYQSDDELTYTSDYFIARKIDRRGISLLGLTQEKGQFYPHSNRIIHYSINYAEKMKALLTNQVVTFSNKITVSNYQNAFHREYRCNLESKRECLKNLIELQNSFHCDVVTPSENLLCINGLINKTNEIMYNREILRDLCLSLKSGQLYDLKRIDDNIKEKLQPDILNLIYACNEHIMSGNASVENRLENENEDLKNNVKSL